MAFHRFRQLPAELRLQIWECAVDNTVLTDGQKRVCRMIGSQYSIETELVTLEDLTIGHVCRESREVFRRCGRLNNSRDYTPATDVVYIDDMCDWTMVNSSSLRQVRHVALPAEICYDMLKIQDPSSTAVAHLGWPPSEQGDSPRQVNSYFFSHMLVSCPEIESITVVLPPLEKDMPHYADYFPQRMRPALLRIVSYSDVQRIRTTGPYTYTTWLRGSSNAKRRCLGPFIKDVNAAWEKEAHLSLAYDDHRRNVTVQAGVLQYLEGPFKGELRWTSIHNAAGQMEEENQTADQDEIVP